MAGWVAETRGADNYKEAECCHAQRDHRWVGEELHLNFEEMEKDAAVCQGFFTDRGEVLAEGFAECGFGVIFA